jgi:hypothetical protein
MDKTAILTRVQQIEGKRGILETLRSRSDLGTLQIDIEQAIEEMDLLLAELKRTFPVG